MNSISTAKIDALLDEQRRNDPHATSETIWERTFAKLSQLEDIEQFIEYGFNPELPSSSQLINQHKQTQLGSNLYTLFVEKGRNPHTLRDSQTLIFSLMDAVIMDHSVVRFSLSDVGMGIHTNMPIAWSKLRAQNLLDWNQPCAEGDGLYVYPAELALLHGNVSLAHRILEDGGLLHSDLIFPLVVAKFLTNAKPNPVVSYRVWAKLTQFNSDICNNVFEQISTEQNWSPEQQNTVKEQLETPPIMAKQRKTKKNEVVSPVRNRTAEKRRNALVENLLDGNKWEVLKDVLLAYDTDNYDIAHCIYDKEHCSLDLDTTNPLTPIVRDICDRQHITALRFLLSKGLRGDQVVNSKTGDTVLHTWLSNRIYPSMMKEYLNATRAILKATSNCSVVNNKGETALFNLLQNNVDFNVISPIIEVAVKRGLDVRVRNHNNETVGEFSELKRGLITFGNLLKNLEIMQDKTALLSAVEDVSIAVAKRRM